MRQIDRNGNKSHLNPQGGERYLGARVTISTQTIIYVTLGFFGHEQIVA